MAGSREDVQRELAAAAEPIEFIDLESESASEQSAAPASQYLGAPARRPELPKRIAKPLSVLSDQENARRIQHQYNGKVISVGKVFYVWDETHWEKDPFSAEAFGLVLNIGNIIEAQYKKQKETATEEDEDNLKQLWAWGCRSGSNGALTACEAILRKSLNFDGKSFNMDRNLFACANGVIDLKTGTLSDHDPLLFITQCSPTGYVPGAPATQWKKFLHEIFNGNENIIGFLQRWLGYSITGEVKEHALVFHEGPGGNGKGVIMDTMQYVMGEAYSVSPANILMYEVKGSSASPEIARLLGKRMVTVSETEDAMVMKEAMVKHLTGGDRLAARHLHEGYFEFMPTHKLQIFTNSKPRIIGQDTAIWRRILRVHYPNQYLTQEQLEDRLSKGEQNVYLRNDDLREILEGEAEGILAWLVEGAKEWYAQGLKVPEEIRAWTNEYKLEMDTAAKFVKERIIEDHTTWSPLSGATGAIFPAYKSWCKEVGIQPWARDRFCKEIIRVIPAAKFEVREQLPGLTGLRLTSDLFND